MNKYSNRELRLELVHHDRYPLRTKSCQFHLSPLDTSKYRTHTNIVSSNLFLKNWHFTGLFDVIISRSRSI